MKSRTWISLSVIALLTALTIPAQLAAQENQVQQPKRQSYKLIDLGTLGGPNSQVNGSAPPMINNAGVVGPSGAIDAIDWEEWVRAIQVNLLGSVLMSRAVLPHFKTLGRGKIIQLSGGGATNPLPGLSAYATSKAAVIRFVETLAEETRANHIDVNAIAPGALNTRMLDEFLAAGPARITFSSQGS